MLPLRVFAGAAVLAVAVAATFAPSGAAQTGTLSGELFVAPGFPVGPISSAPPAECNADGTSTVHFRAEGIASGPYPGTFTETGTYTLGPQNTPFGSVPTGLPGVPGTGMVGPVLTFEAQFEIQSGLTVVTGTKTLSATLQGVPHPSYGACADFQNSTIIQPPLGPGHGIASFSGTVYSVDAVSRYEATITTGSESTTDTGEAGTNFNDVYITESVCVEGVPNCPNSGAASNPFVEGFTSTPVGPPPTTAGCKVTLGGWIAPLGGGTGSFGGEAQADDQGQARGELGYHDHAADLRFKSETVDSLFCAGSRAQIYGQGTVGGQPVSYEIDVTDGGSADTFRIHWTGSSTYHSGEQPLEGGNVTMH
ncbi:MAG TPA: post-COAP-1 domain-containing protein [Gaiellaceae bacterium]|jgi:hypothetical protein|nr:post-COAP-1 domain-containing protein [Gaiellaceae bacterium]